MAVAVAIAAAVNRYVAVAVVLDVAEATVLAMAMKLTPRLCTPCPTQRSLFDC